MIHGSSLNARRNLVSPSISQHMGNPSQCLLYPRDAQGSGRLRKKLPWVNGASVSGQASRLRDTVASCGK